MTTRPTSRRSAPVRRHRTPTLPVDAGWTADNGTEEKAHKEMAAKAGGKGPLNTGTQGIKKSGKK